MAQSGLLIAVKSLVGKSVVYGLGSIFLRSINFLLLPLYTRYLTPADYGVMAVTTTITAILSLVYPLSMHAALTPFYYNAQNEVERRRNNGVIWLGLLLAAASMTLLLDNLGNSLFSLIFREVPFVPYIRLAVWTAFFNILSLLPLTLFQIQERPGIYVLVSIMGTLLSIGLVITMVVFQGQGAYGYLLGTLFASILMAGPYLALTLRQVQITLKWDILKAALLFSLPLVPHGVAGWVLELSDRVILERYVSLSQLGLYALGYQLGAVMNIAATAINNAWVPYLFKTHAERGDKAQPDLARLTTYYILVLSWVALGLALLIKDMLLLLTTPAFHAADQVTLWIVAGLWLSGLYYIPVNFLFLKSKTGWVPVVTVLSGLVNVGLNLWLVPRYGIMAAAWATFLAYGLMLVLVWRIALRVYPFPYEYKRLGLIALAAAILFASGSSWHLESLSVDLGLKIILLVTYPVVLAMLGFFTPTERGMVVVLARQTMASMHRSIRQV